MDIFIYLILIFFVVLIIRGHFSLKSSKKLVKGKNITFPENFTPHEEFHSVDDKGKLCSTLYVDKSTKNIFYIYKVAHSKTPSTLLFNFTNIHKCQFINDSLKDNPNVENSFIKKLGIKLKLRELPINEIDLMVVNDKVYVGRSKFYSNQLFKTSNEYYNFFRKLK